MGTNKNKYKRTDLTIKKKKVPFCDEYICCGVIGSLAVFFCFWGITRH